MNKMLEISINNNKAICPFCNKPYAVPSSRWAIGTQGIWAHIKAKHAKEKRPGLFENLEKQVSIYIADNIKAEKAAETERKAKEAAIRKEEREAPKRIHKISGALLMDIVSELEGALDMMEPYYSQCDADEDGRAMIKQLEDIIASKGIKC